MLEILNKAELDKFLFERRDNGCTSIPHPTLTDDGLPVNGIWQDNETGEHIIIRYEGDTFWGNSQ